MSISDSLDDGLQDRVHEALKTAFSADGDIIVTRWVLSVELYTSTGKACLHISAADMLPWEIVGMSELSSEAARIQFGTSVMDDLYPEYEGTDDDDDER